MMGDEFRLGRRDRRELSAQGIGDLPVQDLPPAFEQGFVGRILDQSMLKGVARIRRRTVRNSNSASSSCANAARNAGSSRPATARNNG